MRFRWPTYLEWGLLIVSVAAVAFFGFSLSRQTIYRIKDDPAAAEAALAMWSVNRTEMAVGTIIWFDSKGGFGFIKPDERGPDLFAHIPPNRGAPNDLTEGDRVSYEIVTSGPPSRTEAIISAKVNR